MSGKFSIIQYIKVLDSKGVKSESIARKIGKSDRQLNRYFSGETSISDEVEIELLEAIEPTEEDYEKIYYSDYKLMFRKKYLDPPSENTRIKARNLARAFHEILGTSERSSSFDVSPRDCLSSNPLEVAKILREKLGLPFNRKSAITLERVVLALRDFNIYVGFYDFEKLGINSKDQSREVAFTSKLNESCVIFLDINRTEAEAFFDLIHELTHIYFNHSYEDQSKDIERFCNAVSAAFIYSEELLNSDEVKKIILARTDEEVQGEFNKILVFNSIDVRGLTIAISNSNMSTKDKGILISKVKKVNVQSSNIKKSYFSNFYKEDRIQEFFEIDCCKREDIFYFFYSLLRGAFITSSLSVRKLSSILNMNSGDVDELSKIWLSPLNYQAQ